MPKKKTEALYWYAFRLRQLLNVSKGECLDLAVASFAEQWNVAVEGNDSVNVFTLLMSF